MLGYRDSGMPETPENADPRAFANADLDEAVGRLVEVVRRERPQVILTYGDDQQGYPHPDHLRVHDISVPAFERAGDPAAYPDAGEPWQPLKLYYSSWSRARIVALHERFLAMGLESPFDERWFERPDQDHRITTARRRHRLLPRARRRPSCPRHPDRSGFTVLVRFARHRRRRDLPHRGLHPGQVVGAGDGPSGGRPLQRHPPERQRLTGTVAFGTIRPAGPVPGPAPDPEACRMAKYLTQEWLDLQQELGASFPEKPGASARMQSVVTGAPGGDAKYHTVIEDGKVLESSMGEDPDAEFTLTTAYDDSVRIAKGELDANAAFMQGKVKVTGNMGKLLTLMPLTQSPEYKDISAKVADQTEF